MAQCRHCSCNPAISGQNTKAYCAHSKCLASAGVQSQEINLVVKWKCLIAIITGLPIVGQEIKKAFGQSQRWIWKFFDHQQTSRIDSFPKIKKSDETIVTLPSDSSIFLPINARAHHSTFSLHLFSL